MTTHKTTPTLRGFYPYPEDDEGNSFPIEPLPAGWAMAKDMILDSDDPCQAILLAQELIDRLGVLESGVIYASAWDAVLVYQHEPTHVEDCEFTTIAIPLCSGDDYWILVTQTFAVAESLAISYVGIDAKPPFEPSRLISLSTGTPDAWVRNWMLQDFVAWLTKPVGGGV